MDRQGQPGVVHARETAEHARKTDRHEGVLALRPVDGDQAVLVEHAEGVEIEIAAEQRAAGGTVLGLDDDRGAGEAAAIDVGQHVAQHAQIAVDAQLLEGRPHLLAMIGGNCGTSALLISRHFARRSLPSRPLLTSFRG